MNPSQPTVEETTTTPTAETLETAPIAPEETNTAAANAETTEPVATHTALELEEDAVIHEEVSTATAAYYESQIEDLKRQLQESNEKMASHWDMVLRQRAEYDNLQKRNARDLDSARKYAIERFAGDLLEVKDSLEMGLDVANKPEANVNTIKEGLEMSVRSFNSTLEKFGIQEIYPLNEKFNPQLHEAMAMQPVSGVEEGTVLVVYQRGYQINERLLRPARVVVAKAMDVAPAAPAEAS